MTKTSVGIHKEPLDLLEGISFVNDAECGAVSSFVGVTRADRVGDKVVVGLEFETHEPLLLAALEQMVDGYRQNVPEVKHVYVKHRIGCVPVGEANVVIVVSAGHRKVSMKAVEDLMDELKATLPVWKKEVFEGGEYVWKENVEFKLGTE